jgi:hypothetical protein
MDMLFEDKKAGREGACIERHCCVSFRAQPHLVDEELRQCSNIYQEPLTHLNLSLNNLP